MRTGGNCTLPIESISSKRDQSTVDALIGGLVSHFDWSAKADSFSSTMLSMRSSRKVRDTLLMGDDVSPFSPSGLK
jgi:hypothetical protein